MVAGRSCRFFLFTSLPRSSCLGLCILCRTRRVGTHAIRERQSLFIAPLRHHAEEVVCARRAGPLPLDWLKADLRR